MTFEWSYVRDLAQIAILYFAFYGILKAARGSRFGQALTGVGVLFGVLIACTYLLHFDVLAVIVRWLLIYLAISSVVIFQSEIRRALATLGAMIFLDRRAPGDAPHLTPEALADGIITLAERRLGALFAFERGISLRGYEMSGVRLDALPVTELLVSVFTPPLPLHDGGMVLRQGRIAAAHCLFPVSSQSELSESGMRHRAAVGMSEETDALVVVVSEERGEISLAQNGRLKRLRGPLPSVRNELVKALAAALPQHRNTLNALVERLRNKFVNRRPANKRGRKERT